jgi:hypothetical protein
MYSLCVLVLFHAGIIVTNTLAFFVLPFAADWFVAVPCMSAVLFLTFARGITCPLTDLENNLRKRVGMKRIGGFMGHYFIKPWRRSWARMKR